MVTKNNGQLLLAIYLILTGVISIFRIDLGYLGFLPPALAVVTGAMILSGK